MGRFYISVVYGAHSFGPRRDLWQDNRSNLFHLEPWLIAGNFNAILEASDRVRSTTRGIPAFDEFANCLNQPGLEDPKYSQMCYSWSTSAGVARKQRKIDQDFELGIYNPRESSTFQTVTCNNSLCAHWSRCPGKLGNSPYTVSYVSAETSASRILVEDVLHLTVEGSHPEYVDAYITFGFGQVQTGSFLDAAAPNGLLGLGMDKTSIPGISSRKGIHQILSPCVLGMMELEELVLETRVVPTRRKPHLM